MSLRGVAAGLFFLLAVAAPSTLLASSMTQKLSDFFAGLFANAGQFAETLEPALEPATPRSFDYSPPDAKFEYHQTQYQGQTRSWYAVGPKLEAEAPLAERRAAIVLLHGAERDGRSMLDMWQHLARDLRLVLIAPNALGKGWSPDTEGETFLRQILAEAEKIYAFDPARVYLFGHSAGANHALRLANRTTGLWRAVAVHAGGLPTSEIGSRAEAVPLRLYLGERDHLFPVDRVRASAQALSRAGHDTELMIIPGHTHWYYVIGPRLARHAWDFFSRY